MPQYSDISKNATNLVAKDFYHLSKALVDVKVALQDVEVTFKGATGKNDVLLLSIDTKYLDKTTGLVLSQGWNTAQAISLKISLPDVFYPGLKGDIASTVIGSEVKGIKANIAFSKGLLTLKNCLDLKKGGISGTAVVGNTGFVGGVDYGVDVYKGKVNKYLAALGYLHPQFSASVEGSNNLSVFTASYFHKVSPVLELGALAVFNEKKNIEGQPVAIEFAGKYKLDNASFVKMKVGENLGAISYNRKVAKGVSLGVGASFDFLRLGEAVHQGGININFSF